MKAHSIILLLIFGGCSLTVSPLGESAERASISAEHQPYREPVTLRQVPDISQDATLRNVVLYALMVNGEVEASYFEWTAAIEQVVLAGALPDPKISLQILSARENFSTLNAFIDAVRVMLDVDLPSTSKRSKQSEIALAQARAAGERFRGARSRLYREVVQAYSELQANTQFKEETETTLSLLQRSQDLSTHRFHSGTAVALIDIRKLQLEIEAQRSELRGLDNQRTQALASLNSLLNREARAPIGKLDNIIVQLSLPESGAMRLTALQRNPALREALALSDAAAKQSESAALEKLPDYGVSVGLDDMLVPYLGATVTLPINRARIDALVRGAEAERVSTLARLRNAESDILARLTIAEAAVRDSERVLADVGQKLVPETQELLELQQSAYGSGEGEVLPILDTERALSSLRRLLISARTKRLGAYAEIAELLATDLFELFPENYQGEAETGGVKQ